MPNYIDEAPPAVAIKQAPIDMTKYVTLENVNLSSHYPATKSGVSIGFIIAGVILAILLFKR
ncbi:MAG: hypothetical protein ABIQ31_17910 [Ferruginibacter sp.]